MSPQKNIAHYRITTKLGEGGMGEVWRATDTKLNRGVAIKILPSSFAQDPDRMARFGREAQVLASLNHPNIAAIYGVEDCALVMELVEGQTLAERIAAGPIPLDEVAPIARQIAEALEYAHERGIVHRDLKPANIKVTFEGRVKVLDFGLAKALSGDLAASDPSVSPTLTMRATMAGMIMGTAGYMSPEQAKGKPVDRRADIWAFGVVLVEMLTGRAMYTGETVSETLASVIKDQPDLTSLPASTPSAMRRLISRCLDKDPRCRLQAIGEARIAIDRAPVEDSPALAAPVAGRRHIPRWVFACMSALTLAGLALGFFLWRATRPVDRPMMRFSVDLGPDAVRESLVTAAISPDGTRLVYSVRAGETTRLATRLLDQSRSTILSGTENGEQPFFSPDGQWIGFFDDQRMKKIPVQGGAAVTLCETTAPPRGASWGEDGYIIANLDNVHLVRVPSEGGPPQPLAKPEDHGERTWRFPEVLPGARLVLFTGTTTRIAGSGYDDAHVEVLSLKTGEVKVLVRGGYFGRYLPSGHLTFVHQGTLFAVPFDLSSLEVRGMPIPVLEDVAGAAGQGGGQLDFSQTGTFVYLSGKSTNSGWSLMWIDSTGKAEPLLSMATAPLTPRLSPDGKLLAVSIAKDIAIYDPQRATTAKLTFNSATNREPVWMPDGKHIAYGGGDGAANGIWWVRTDGSSQPQRLLTAKEDLTPTSVTPDGRRIAFSQGKGGGPASDILTLPLDLADPDRPIPGKPEIFLSQPGGQSDAVFSPDGRWIAYAAFQGLNSQVFVQPFPANSSGGKWLISNAGGRFPVWSRNGRELFYLAVDGRIMVAGYTAKGDSFTVEKAQPWSPTPLLRTGNFRNYDLSADGKRIIAFPTTGGDTADKSSVHVTVLLNFFDELRRKVK